MRFTIWILAVVVVICVVMINDADAAGATKKKSAAKGSGGKTVATADYSDEDFQVDSPLITDMNREQLGLVLQERNWPVFILFTRMSSGSSQVAWSQFKIAAEALQGVVPMAHINCMKKANADICQNYCDKSFPRYLLFPPGLNRAPLAYSYDHRADMLVDFVLGSLDTYVAHVEDKEWKPFLRKAKDYPRVLFLSNDKWLDPRLNTIAFQHRLRSIIGKITNPSTETLTHFGLKSSDLPTAVSYTFNEQTKFKLFGDQITDNWEKFGKFVSEDTLEQVRNTQVNPLEFHESFSSARIVSKVEMLNATRFEEEVFEINSTKTVVVFFHRWMLPCRQLLTIYEDVPALLADSSIEIGALDFDVDINAASAIRNRFYIDDLPAIIYFPGDSEPPYKMQTLYRTVEDKPVTADEIALWARVQDDFVTRKLENEAAERKAEEARQEEVRKDREAKGLPPLVNQAKSVILDLEDSDADDLEAGVENHMIVTEGADGIFRQVKDKKQEL